MAFGTALSTAFGMSFLSMLMMEISMEVTDLIFTNGELGLDWRAIPFMLMAGFSHRGLTTTIASSAMVPVVIDVVWN